MVVPHRAAELRTRLRPITDGQGRPGKADKMNDDFMAAMRQTLDAVRAGNPAKATRLIQGALAGTGAPAAQAPAQKPDRPAGAARRPSRPLSQVLADLAARAPGQAANLRGPVRAPDLPEGAVFESRRHDGPHGARDYRLFRPSGRKGPIRGVVRLHPDARGFRRRNRDEPPCRGQRPDRGLSRADPG